MNTLYNFTPDGNFYVSSKQMPDGIWKTVVYKYNRKTGEVDYTYTFEEILSLTRDIAFVTHQKCLYKWSGDSDMEDVLGIGEGYY